METIINSTPISIKGYVKIQAHRNGELIYEHEQPNLWLDQGIRRMGWGIINSKSNPYLCLSSNVVQPTYTSVTIPSVLVSQQLAGSRQDSYRRWMFQGTFNAGAGIRNINTVGLAYSSDGTNAHCYTVLTTPLVQDTLTTITVWYYVYVNSASQNAGLGFGAQVNEMWYRSLFYTSYARYNMIVDLTDVAIPENALPDEVNWTIIGLNDSTLSYTGTYLNRAHVSDLINSRREFDWTHMRTDSGIMGAGNSGDLTSWTSAGWTGLSVTEYGPARRFTFNTLGRMWGKRYLNSDGSGTSPGSWYNSNYTTNGYMKGFQVRPKSLTWSPSSGDSGIKVEHPLYRIYPVVPGDLTATAPVTGASYYFYKYDHVWRPNSNNHPEWSANRVKIHCAEILYNKFGRNILVWGKKLSDSDVNNTNNLHTYMENLDSYGGIRYLVGRTCFPVYDEVPDYPNQFYMIDVKANNKDRDIIKIASTDSTWNTIAATLDATYPGSNIIHAYLMADKRMLLWDRNNGKIALYDTVGKTFSDSWIAPVNILLGNSAFHDTYRSWGAFDKNTGRIFMLRETSLIEMNIDGVTTYNNFGVSADFSVSGTYFKDWSHISCWSAPAYYQNNKLYMMPSRGYNWNTGFTGNYLAQYVSAGPFEFTTAVTNYCPLCDVGSGGMIFALDAYEIPKTTATSSINGKKVFLYRGASDTRIYSANTTAGVSTWNDGKTNPLFMFNGSSALNYYKGSAVNIASSGGYYSGNGSNPAYLWDKNTNNTWNMSSNWSWQYSIYKFNNATIVNMFELVAYSTSYWPNSIEFSGSNDASNWTVLNYKDGMSTSSSDYETRGFYFNNTTPYLYYRVYMYGYNPIFRECYLYSVDTTSYYTTQGVSARLKITRDESNILRTYYSLDNLETSDASASWTQLGNSSLAVSGNMMVGLSASYLGTWNDMSMSNIEVSQFNMNSGTLDRRVQSMQIVDNTIPVSSLYYSGANNLVINDCRTVSKWGGVIITNNGHLHAITRRGIVTLSASALDYIKTKYYSPTKSIYHYCGYFHDNRDGSVAGAFLINNNTSWRPDSNAYNTGYSDIEKYYHYQIDDESWILQEYPVPQWSDDQGCGYPHTMLCNKGFLNIAGGYTWQWSGTAGAYCKYALIGEIHRARFGWNASLNKWLEVDFNLPVSAGGLKPAHTGWEDLIEDVQIKCVDRPANPNTSFSNLDYYEVYGCRGGFPKDNQQYFTGLRIVSYMGNATKVTDTLVTPATTSTLPTYTNPAISAQWITADFQADAVVYFKNASTSAYSYYTTSTTANISSVATSALFYSDTGTLSKGYGYYYGSYVSYGGEIKRILRYDSYDKSFETEGFTVPLSAGTIFSIVQPLAATRITTPPTSGQPNYYCAEETYAKFMISSMDTDKIVEATYVYLLRTW